MYYYSAYIPDLVANLYDALPPENTTEMLPLYFPAAIRIRPMKDLFILISAGESEHDKKYRVSKSLCGRR